MQNYFKNSDFYKKIENNYIMFYFSYTTTSINKIYDMPRKVDPELKAFKKEMAEYKKGEGFKNRIKAIKEQIAAQGVANRRLKALQNKE